MAKIRTENKKLLKDIEKKFQENLIKIIEKQSLKRIATIKKTLKAKDYNMVLMDLKILQKDIQYLKGEVKK